MNNLKPFLVPKTLTLAINLFLLGGQSSHAEKNTEQKIQNIDQSSSWILKPIKVTAERDQYSTANTSAATRTDTPLNEVPQSVQIITSTLLKEQDKRSLGDALVNVSGVTPTRSDENLFIPPIVRGFPAEVYLDGLLLFAGNQQAFDPTKYGRYRQY